MKVLIVNTSDIRGGAAMVARRLVSALRDSGVDTTMLVANRYGADSSVSVVADAWHVKLKFLLERLKIFFNNGFSRRNLFKVSIANTGFDITKIPEFREADVIHLHWINQGLLSLDDVRKIAQSGKPVVWTMHDMWECTAICHHAYDCEHYMRQCGYCMFLRHPHAHDISYRVFKQKQQLVSDTNIQYVAVSTWLAGQCAKSAILGKQDVQVIHNPLPLDLFIRNDSTALRAKHGIHENDVVLCMGAARLDDPIKGFGVLIDAVREISEKRETLAQHVHLILFGSIRDAKQLDQISIPYTFLGSLSNISDIIDVYSASDIVLSTSYFETLPTTLIEGMACGCLPVSFGRGGQADIFTHMENGYMAEYGSPESIADGIEWASKQHISADTLHNYISSRFSSNAIVEKYICLYDKLLAERNN